MTLSIHDDGLDDDAIKARVRRQVEAHGPPQYEIFVETGASLSIDLERGSLKNAEVGRDSGVGIRVANKDGQSAFSYTSQTDPTSIDRVVRTVISTMRMATPDPDFVSFAGTAPAKNLPGGVVFDPSVERLTIDDAVQLVKGTMESALREPDPRVHSVNVSFKASCTRVSVLNSNGIDAREDQSDAMLTCEVTVKDGGEMSSDYDFTSGRDLGRISVDVGGRATRRALKTLGKVRVKTGFYPVVIGTRAVGAVLAGAIASGVNAEVVQQGMSFLGGMIGKQIAPDHFSLIDDPRLESGTRALSCSFDGEGFPTRRKSIVNGGTLETLLHNSYTANKAGVESTGNAARSGYTSPPRISQFNLVVQPRRDHVDHGLLEGIRHGIYFDQTYDSPNLTTGDFSGMIASGFLIEDGVITSPISQANFGVKLLDLFNSIEMYGDELDDRAGIVTPPIRLKGLHVSGSL
ncbi:MAG: TldD/PmbA family protein [Candidatus Lokiarchaeota archaeon]|nr:TldD/PmbA family protein [Candidatus Lokiarchaeota archaeon]